MPKHLSIYCIVASGIWAPGWRLKIVKIYLWKVFAKLNYNSQVYIYIHYYLIVLLNFRTFLHITLIEKHFTLFEVLSIEWYDYNSWQEKCVLMATIKLLCKISRWLRRSKFIFLTFPFHFFKGAKRVIPLYHVIYRSSY